MYNCKLENCLDMSRSLQDRIDSLTLLDDQDLNEVLEIICSAFNITPVKIFEEYIYFLILYEKISISRRIRIAESCDMYRHSLYLLSKIPDTQVRISYIEMFSNPYLKIHAYMVLFHKVGKIDRELEYQIQIMKNLWSLVSKNYKSKYIQWFLDIMKNNEVSYNLKSNCADFLLSQDTGAVAKQKALQFLNISEDVLSNTEFFDHKENVHILLPKIDIVSAIVEKNKKCKVNDIYDFIINSEYKDHINFFNKRIVNDKTSLHPSQNITLLSLILSIWLYLSDSLKLLLIQDITSSSIKKEHENTWMCTTGYYHRILNIYQVVYQDDNLFYEDEWVSFFRYFKNTINKSLFEDENKDVILDNMIDEIDNTEFRIKYLTFKAHSLPKIISKLRTKFSFLSDDLFDDYFQKALRRYESFL